MWYTLEAPKSGCPSVVCLGHNQFLVKPRPIRFRCWWWTFSTFIAKVRTIRLLFILLKCYFLFCVTSAHFSEVSFCGPPCICYMHILLFLKFRPPVWEILHLEKMIVITLTLVNSNSLILDLNTDKISCVIRIFFHANFFF